jgi:hypothetical protein
MHPLQRAAYDRFVRDLRLDLGESILDGTAPAQLVLRAAQIMETPFAMPDPRGAESPRIDLLNGEFTGKEKMVELHLEDHKALGTPVVLFAVFIAQQERLLKLAQAAGLRAALINGRVTPAQTNRIDEAFRAGEIDCLVCSPECAEVGFNWQFWGRDKREVDHLIFVSLNYMDTTFLQAYRRFMREKREGPLRVTVLQYERSIDAQKFAAIERKSRDANLIDPTREVFQLQTAASRRVE